MSSPNGRAKTPNRAPARIKALDPQVLPLAPSAPVTTQAGGGGSGCHRRRVVSAGGSPRLSAFHHKRDYRHSIYAMGEVHILSPEPDHIRPVWVLMLEAGFVHRDGLRLGVQPATRGNSITRGIRTNIQPSIRVHLHDRSGMHAVVPASRADTQHANPVPGHVVSARARRQAVRDSELEFLISLPCPRWTVLPAITASTWHSGEQGAHAASAAYPTSRVTQLTEQHHHPPAHTSPGRTSAASRSPARLSRQGACATPEPGRTARPCGERQPGRPRRPGAHNHLSPQGCRGPCARGWSPSWPRRRAGWGTDARLPRHPIRVWCQAASASGAENALRSQ
jgi:hypothetical protein